MSIELLMHLGINWEMQSFWDMFLLDWSLDPLSTSFSCPLVIR